MVTLYKGSICCCLDVSTDITYNYQLRSLISKFEKSQTYLDFANRRRIWKDGKMTLGPPIVKAKYYLYHNERIYLPIPTMDRLVRAIKASGIDVKVLDVSNPEPDKINLSLNPDLELYPVQKESIARMKGYNSNTVLLSLQPGGGKTFTSIVYAIERGYRFMVFAKSGYLDQWESEIRDQVETDNIVVIKGTASLIKLLTKADVEGIIPDIILISLATYRSYVKRWLQGDDRITIAPDELADVLKLGTVLSDEVHKEMTALWQLISLTNVDKLVGLSGTMSSDDVMFRRAQEDMFPYDSRYIEGNLKPYIELVTYYYGARDPATLRYTPNGRSTYQQVAYEKWILGSALRRKTYMDMIGDIVFDYYIKDKKPHDRCLIFVGLVKLSAMLISYLKTRFKEHNLSYIDFTGTTTKEETNDIDIIVSNVAKAGTAIDFLGLTRLINTVSVSKVETAKQNIQRLRRAKNRVLKHYHNYKDDRDRVCIQLQNADIPQHQSYARNRLRLSNALITKKTFIQSDYRI